jgi:hypothetical protein
MRGGGCKGSVASEARSGSAEESRPGSAGTVGKTELTSGPHVQQVDGEKASRMKGVNPRRKRTSAFTPTARVG